MPHRLVLPPGTVAVLRHLVGRLVALHDEAPADDRAWQRLYPSTTADPRLDRDLRELVHPDLVDGRLAAFEAVGEVLAEADADASRLDLDDDQAVAFLGVVNDIRLAVAADVDLPGLLGDDGRLPPDLPEATRAAIELVDWLSLLQDQVLASLAPESLAYQQELLGAVDADEWPDDDLLDGGDSGDDAAPGDLEDGDPPAPGA